MPGRTPRKTATSERSADSSSSATALRTVTCGELTAADEGQRVVLAGWVAHRRDYGKLIFIDLRDRYGLTQVVIDPERSPEAAAAHACRRRGAAGVRAARRGRGGQAAGRQGESGAGDRRDRGRGAARRGAEHREDAAVPHRRPRRGRRGAAAALPLPRPAPRQHARATSSCATARSSSSATIWTSAASSRSRRRS